MEIADLQEIELTSEDDSTLLPASTASTSC